MNIGTSLLQTEDNNAIDLDLNADAISEDLIQLKRWKDPDKKEPLHIKDKKEMETAICRSIVISGAYNNRPDNDVPQRSVMTSKDL